MATIGVLTVGVRANTDDFTAKMARAALTIREAKDRAQEFRAALAGQGATLGNEFGSWTQSLRSAVAPMGVIEDKALGMNKAVNMLAQGGGVAGGVLGQMSAALMGLPLPLGLAAAAVVGLKAAFDSSAESAARAAEEMRKVRDAADAAITRVADQDNPDPLRKELDARRAELAAFQAGQRGATPSAEMYRRLDALRANVTRAEEAFQAGGASAALAERERLRPSVDPVIAAAMRARESESLGAPGRQAQERAEADLEIAKAAAAQKEDNAKFDAKIAEQAEKSSQAMRDFATSLKELNETPVEKFTQQVGHIIDVFNDPRSGLEAGVAGRAIQKALDDTGLLKQAKPGSVMELGSQMSVEAFRGGKETTESEKRAAEQVGLLEGILNELTGGLDVNIPDAE